MSAVIIWIILKVLFWIGMGAVALYFLFFTDDGRQLLKWIAGIGAALGIAVFAATNEPVWIAVGVAIGAALTWQRP